MIASPRRWSGCARVLAVDPAASLDWTQMDRGRNGRIGQSRYGEGQRTPRARQRALCIAAGPEEADLGELRELLRTAGAAVVGEMTQKRPQADPDRYFGKGKLAELKQAVKDADANLVACDDELLPVSYTHL